VGIIEYVTQSSSLAMARVSTFKWFQMQIKASFALHGTFASGM
jgi:hypothetical protein